jgi:glycolate oxidase FAD binding subunit
VIVTPSSIVDAAAALKQGAGTVLIRGSGSKQDWGGKPPSPDLTIDTTGLTGIVEHEPGDLVAVVGAGTPLSTLQAALADKGQQLALDSPHPDATIGGIVATNVSGPRRLRYGTARDLLIGITIVRADGIVARAGGKVVKNVAGYDLGKLFVGSYGTLGLIAECAFRLHPLPAALIQEREVLGLAEAIDFATRARRSPRAPIAIELDWRDDLEVCVTYDGVPAWDLPGGAWLFKLTCALSRLEEVLRGARDAAQRHGIPLHLKGSLGVGVLYGGAPEATPEFVRDLRAVTQTVVLTAPRHDGIDLWGPTPGLELMRRVKAQFDPEARLAPGRFVGGI